MWSWKPLVCDARLVWSELHQTILVSKLVTTPIHPEPVLKSKVVFVFIRKVKWCNMPIRRSYLTNTVDTRQTGAKLEQYKVTVWQHSFYYMFPGVIIRAIFWCFKHKHWQGSPRAFQGLAQHTKLASSILLPWKNNLCVGSYTPYSTPYHVCTILHL